MVFYFGVAFQRLAWGWLLACARLHGVLQGGLFALLTLVSTFISYRVIHSQVKSTAKLNQLSNDIIGHQFVLEKNLENGRGRVQLGSSSWPIVAQHALPAGCKVVVIAIEGVVLKVEALTSGAQRDS